MSPVRPARTRSRFSAELAVASIVASIAAVAVLAGMRVSPYSPRLMPGDGPAAPLHAVARGFGLDALSHRSGVLLGIAVMALGLAAFVYGLRAAWRGELSVRTVLGLAVAFQVVVALLPVLFSQDVYSYTMYGRIAAIYHGNPYVTSPAHYPHDAVYPFVGSGWRTTPAVYGPVFTLLSEGLARVLHSPLALIWSFKAVAAVAAIATLVLITWIARRLVPGRAAFAVALFGWNPVMVAYATGGGHNDVLVALCVAGAFALWLKGRDVPDPARRRWELGAVAVLTLGCLIKIGIAPALVLTMVATVASRPRGQRRRLLAQEIGVAAVLTVAFAAPYWQLHDPTLGVKGLVGHREWIAPMRFLLASLGGIAETIGGQTARTVIEVLIRVTFAATAVWALAVVAVMIARRAGATRSGDGAPSWTPAADGAAWGWSLLILMLASPVILPWYLGWMLPVAWLMPRTARNLTIGVSLILALTHSIARPALVTGLFNVWLVLGHDVFGPLLFLILVALVLSLEKMRRVDATLEDPALVETAPVATPPVPAPAAAG